MTASIHPFPRIPHFLRSCNPPQRSNLMAVLLGGVVAGVTIVALAWFFGGPSATPVTPTGTTYPAGIERAL